MATIVFASKKSILASNIRTAAKTAPTPPCVIVPITVCPLNSRNHFEEQRRGIVQRRREIGNGRVGETRGEISRTRNDFIIDRMLITIDNFTRNKFIFPRYSILIEMCKEYSARIRMFVSRRKKFRFESG